MGQANSIRNGSLLIRLVFGLLVVLLYCVSAGADETEQSADALDDTVDVAPVIIDGEILFEVRGVSAFPAEKRAARIVERIEKIAENHSLSATAYAVVDVEHGSQIAFSGEPVMNVFNRDAKLFDREALASLYAQRISEAIQAYRHDRTAEYLLRSTLFSVAASVVLGIILWLGRLALRWIDSVFNSRIKTRLEGLEAKSLRILSAHHLWVALRGMRQALWLAVVIATAVTYLNFVLRLFPWTRLLSKQLFAMLIKPLHVIGESILVAIPDLVFLVILALVTHYILKTIRLFFAGLENGNISVAWFEPDWAWPTYRLVRLLVVAFAVVVGYPYIPGSGSGAFKGISLMLGLIFSLGSTSIISNIIAGYSLIYRRAFRVGDMIGVDTYVGEVMQARMLVTDLRTIKNEIIVIPNSVLQNSCVVNYSTQASEGKLILHTDVGIGYETPWRQVEAMLLQAAERTEGTVKGARPFVLQKSLGDFCVVYEINVFCADAHAMPELYTQLHRHILDVFNEYGVQIMTPAYIADPQQPKVVLRDQWYLAPANSKDSSAGR